MMLFELVIDLADRRAINHRADSARARRLTPCQHAQVAFDGTVRSSSAQFARRRSVRVVARSGTVGDEPFPQARRFPRWRAMNCLIRSPRRPRRMNRSGALRSPASHGLLPRRNLVPGARGHIVLRPR